MPSATHETLIRLVRDEPGFVAALLRRRGMSCVDTSGATLVSENASVLQYAERRVDSVVSLTTPDNVGLVCAVEVQLGKNTDKLFTWPTYVTRLREDTRKPVALLVLCGTDIVAGWAGRPIEVGPGSLIQPIAIGPSDIPRIVDPDAPEATPEMTTLSVILHGNGDGGTDVIDAMNIVYSRMSDQDRAVNYTDYVYRLLSGNALMYLETQMSTHAYPFHSAFTQRYVAQGKAEGEAEGEAKGKAQGKAEAVLDLLHARGVPVSDGEQQHILQCTDHELLTTWLVQAMKAESAADLLEQTA